MPTDNQTESTRSAVSNIMQMTEEFLGDCQAELTRGASVRRDEAAAFVKELRQSARDRLHGLRSALSNEARSTREGLARYAAEIQRDAALARHDARIQLKSISEARLADAQSLLKELRDFSDMLHKEHDAATAARRSALGSDEPRFHRSCPSAAKRQAGTGALAAVDYTIGKARRPAA